MDSLMMCVSGHVGKVQGASVDRQKRDVFKFSLACNFKHPESTLWLQCTVVNHAVYSLCVERGILVGDHVLVVIDRADINAQIIGDKAKSWLNCEINQITFLKSPVVPELERGEGYSPRIIEYENLMKVG